MHRRGDSDRGRDRASRANMAPAKGTGEKTGRTWHNHCGKMYVNMVIWGYNIYIYISIYNDVIQISIE